MAVPFGSEKWGSGYGISVGRAQDSLSAVISFVLARPTTLEFLPHSCNLSEIRRSALGSFLATDLPSAPYDKSVWDRLTAMRAFDHARSLEKGLLFCQQRVSHLIGPSPTSTPPAENTQVEFLPDCFIRDEGRSRRTAAPETWVATANVKEGPNTSSAFCRARGREISPNSGRFAQPRKLTA